MLLLILNPHVCNQTTTINNTNPKFGFQTSHRLLPECFMSILSPPAHTYTSRKLSFTTVWLLSTTKVQDTKYTEQVFVTGLFNINNHTHGINDSRYNLY